MLNVWFYSIVSVVIVSLVSLAGVVTLAFNLEKLKKILIFFVSLSAGALLGDVFLHLLPELVEEAGFGLKVSLLFIAGIFIFFILEKYIHWQHCHEPISASHPHHLGKMNLIGDALHNFIDGLIIAASYLISVPLGVASTLAIVFHEIPQEIGDFGVLLHSGFSKAKALGYNLLSASFSVLGGILGYFASHTMVLFASYLVPVAAGGFLYIATADLIPELGKVTSTKRTISMVATFLLGVT